MEKLTNKEEEIMQVLWKIKRGFVKDIIELLPEPKPHYNTVSTIIRKLEKKGFVAHKAYGKTHEYYPIIPKKNYRNAVIQKAVKNYFENSYKNLVVFFAKEEKIDAEELKEIIRIIEKSKDKS